MDLSVRLETLRDTCKECWKSVKKISNDIQLAEKLAQRILSEKHAQHIAVACPDILIDLLNRLKLRNAHDEALGCALASFKSKDVEYWAEDYFSRHGVSFLDRFTNAEKEVLANGEPAAKKLKKSDSQEDLRVLRAATVFLRRNPEFYGNLWDFSFASLILSKRSRGPDPRLKWYAAHCLAYVNQMSSEDLDAQLSMHFTKQEIETYRKEDFDSSLENENRRLVQRVALSKPCDTVDIEGVTIYADSLSTTLQEDEDAVVYTPSFRRCLREVASTVVANKAVLVTGAVGVGKTKLIEHLANKTRNKLFKVQLGNHVDSKTLVGSYCCTDIAGQFRWQPGLLTKAVREGHWILLEDLDYASADVITLLIVLLQERKLPGAQGATLKVKSSFRLFSTIRVVGSDRHSELVGNCQSVEGLFSKVHMPLQSDSEIRQILIERCRDLEMFVPRMIELYRRVQDRLSKEPQCKRVVSLRDLVKLISRYAKCLIGSDADRLRMFVDATDCLTSYIPCPTLRLSLAKTEIGPRFNLVAVEIEDELVERKPQISSNERQSTIGRCVVPKRTLTAYDQPITSCSDLFAQTRVSLVMLEKIARCVHFREPVLLVGETGTGKTTVVQHLAQLANCQLRVINLSQQTDMVDLVGGFKPVPLRRSVAKLIDELHDLLSIRSKLLQPNVSYLENLKIKLAAKSYQGVAESIGKTCRNMYTAFKDGKINVEAEWGGKLTNLESRALAMVAQIESSENRDPMAFAFIEGILVTSMRNGDWILLDEINLAEPEMLECLASILDGQQLIIQERGDLEPIKVHPGFRIFACMNPATDVGKRDLPVGVRNRFTELYFDEISAISDLNILTYQYLKGVNSAIIGKCVELFTTLKQLSKEKLFDATGHRPHFCLRTFCRALRFAARKIQEGNSAPRSVYEGFGLSFLTQVDAASHLAVEAAIGAATLGKNAPSVLAEQMRSPSSGKFVHFQGYWVPRGDEAVQTPSDYILTPTVLKNLKDLARAVSARRHPILLQGGTSLGKTSMISYMAKCTGNKCVRVNNHEHTDIAEYVGQYLTDADGALVFKEGILVEAMRKGYWIILDELNLACSEILEALNRVLDDNRKLFIPETQTEVEAHENFIVFATQNPPGTYAGRKILSRAFRNRFIELHFNELPRDELKQILSEKCELSPAHSAKMVEVMVELQLVRKGSGVFSGKEGFITLRDLFKWAERHRRIGSEGFRDWDQLLAEEGYMLLAGRIRKAEDEEHIIRALKKAFKREVKPECIWRSSKTTEKVRLMLEDWSNTFSREQKNDLSHLVLTQQMRRLAILVGQALQFDEPVLIVGETGSGKTTIVQLFAQILHKHLFTVSCHQHSEASDFLGGLRPCRDSRVDGRLFEWNDGPLIKAMSSGDFFLADEISLADDSVLERLNSLLEAEKTIFLAEKGEGESFTAANGFWFAATMNPGGDFGKKELSPALRNRFTEIWCPFDPNDPELIDVVHNNLARTEGSEGVAEDICKFSRYIHDGKFGVKSVVSLRDIMAWVKFVNTYWNLLGLRTAFVHGGVMTFLDPIGTGVTSSEQRDEICEIRQKGYECLTEMASSFDVIVPGDRCIGVCFSYENICVMPYELRRKVPMISEGPQEFHFSVQTTRDNLMRLVRGLGLGRPLLLEGSPGVGKTSLVVALAKQYGVEITRINLSEQTDISDLFGADLPVEGGTGGQFQWRDGPFLRALKMGHWILLDELNLASQSVLEGLNACLDHRGEIFIPELNQSFKVAQGCTEIFACQNPQRQGGGRKGLPKSFLNRFTQVHVDPLSEDDLRSILSSLFPALSDDQASLMVELNSRVIHEIEQGLWGQSGSPWEFNLRDLCRWAELAQTNQDFVQSAQFIYGDRLRTRDDKDRVSDIIEEVFRTESKRPFPKFGITSSTVQVGDVFLGRDPRPGTFEYPTTGVGNLRLLHAQRHAMHSVMSCLNQGMLCIVVGESGCGKTSVIRQTAALAGRKLVSLPISAEMDTIELLGGFEQMDLERELGALVDRCCEKARALVSKLAREKKLAKVEAISRNVHILRNFDSRSEDPAVTDVFLAKISFVRGNLSTWECSELESALDEVSKKYSSLSARGNFTWCDSALVKAIQEGEWILAENVNFCAPSVLDRLNSLLEKNGSLSITEQGVQDGTLRTLRPHANFRLIMTMNPKHGEISRAMRNRGHEIFMLPLDETIDAHDMKALLEARGCFDERISEKLWCIFDQLRPYRSSSLVNSILKAVDYMEDEAGRGGPALDVLAKYLTQSFESSINGEVDVELILRSALQGLDQPRGSQETASVNNFASGTVLAEHFEDSAILRRLTDELQDEDQEIQMVKNAVIIHLFCENIRYADDPLKLAMIESKSLRSAVASVLQAFVARIPNYPKHLPIDHRFNIKLARRLNVENHFANTFVFSLLENIAVNTYLQPAAMRSERSESQTCDTYMSVSEKQLNLHPHAMVRQLPKLFEVIEKFFDELTSSPMSDEQLFAAKRSIYAIWRYGQNAHSPVRNVEVDIRRIAVMYIWAMKRMRLVSTEKTTPLLMELTDQLEKCVPALFSRARKIRKRAVQCVGTAKVFRNREAAELYQRAIALRTRAERATEQISMQLSDVGSAVVACAVTEVEKLTNQILPLVDSVTHDLLENGSTPTARRCEIVNFEKRLEEFLRGDTMHRYDENYVYRMSYDHEQELDKHLQPLKDVLRLRTELADTEDKPGAEFMSKYVDLAQASWNCLNELQSKLEWRPPHIMLTLDSAEDFFGVPEVERKRHSSALVFDSSAIVSCLGDLVDSETNAAANLHLDYSQTKLREVEEIRRLLWNQASVDSRLATKTLRILTEVFQSVRGVIAENRSSLTAELRFAFSEAEAASVDFDPNAECVKLEDHLYRIHVAHFLLLLFTPYDTMDPYEKVLMKKNYLASERQHLLMELDLRVWLQKRRTGSEDLDPHPVHSSNVETCENIAKKIRDLDERSAYRPEPSQFGDMAKTAQSYVENIANPGKVRYFLDAILRGDDVDAELDTWLTNQKEFISRIRLSYPLYRDITMAFLFGAAQLVTAFESFHHFTLCRKIKGNLGDLIKFPRMPSSMQADAPLVTVNQLICARPNTRGTAEEDLRLQWSLKMRECKAELLEILDAIRTSSGTQEKLLGRADRILGWFSSQYVEYTEQEAERALTKDSLYEIRTIDFKGEERDEVLDAKAIAAMFPNFEECYDDIIDDRDFLNKEKQLEKQQRLAEEADFRKFTDDDLSFVHRVFVEIIVSATTNHRNGPSDVVSSLLERFRLFQGLRPDFKTSLNIKVDDDSYPAHLLAAAYTGWTITGDEQKLEKFVKLGSRRHNALKDFYNDSNISELVKCQPIVHQIVDHCKQLLGDFENHHGLVQTLRVSYRVLSLPVTSSLMKVLTGLMKLLTELEEWNKNAHRGIKMAAETECLAQLITSWRKLELQSWSGLLEAAVDKRKIEATKFWLRLQHALSKSSSTTKGSSAFDADEETVKTSVKELMSALVNLMEVTTTVGDYEHKLQMLSDLASYVKLRNSAGDGRIHTVIMNAHAFYKQFLPAVSAKIESTKAEIDKEIKDFIKIVRYKDTSFLAVQQSADKSHKKLHGCLKNFEKVLAEPSTTYIEQTPEESPVAVAVKKGKRKVKNTETTDFDVANYNIKTVPLKVVSEGMDTLSNIPRLHRLSRSYLHEVSQQLRVEPISNVLDELATDIADGVSKFAKETEKQIRHDDKDAKRKAKNLLQRKKKMLSELFRELTKCGVSYRKGVAFYQKSNFLELLSTKLIRSSEVPTAVAHLVEDIERYYVRSVQKFRDLQKAMQSPSRELELYMIERLQGFGTHLFETISSDSNQLHDVCQASRQLRKKLSTFRQVANFETVPEQKSNSKKKTEVHSMMFKLSFCLHQFLALLETLPSAGKDSHTSEELRFDSISTAFNKVNERLVAQLKALDEINSTPLSESNLKTIDDSVDSLKVILVEVQGAIGLLESENRRNCITGPYCQLREEIENQLVRIDSLDRCEEGSRCSETDAARLERCVRRCLKRTLQSVQDLRRTFEGQLVLESEDLINDSVKLLEDEQNNVFSKLDIKGVLSAFEQVEKRLATLRTRIPSGNLSSFVGFMRNFSSHFEYFVACALKSQRAKLKLLFIVLSVSVTLTQKGFCIPEEFRDELTKEGASQLQDIEDGGLGDGEGQKDKSDKVDCEDQLEDTHHPGKEKQEDQEEDQKDIEDEKDGIEMSEDFDAKAQGPDEKEEDEDQNEEKDDDDDDKDDDLDEQMGDVDDVDPFDLDKEMWDKDDEEQQNMDSDDDAQGGEELEEENQVVAKDDRVKKDEKDQKENDDKENEKPNEDENPEDKINEMDDEYEGEKEDPYKSNKEKGLDEDDEVEDFELPDQQMEDEENAESSGDDAGDAMDDKGEEESDAEGDTEFPADEAMPEDLQEEAMEQDAAEAEAKAPEDEEEMTQDQEADQPEEASEHPEVAKPTADDHQPEVEQAEGAKSSAESGLDENQNLAESAQTSDDIDGTGDGQSNAADSGGLGRKSTAKEQSMNEEGKSKENEKKQSSKDRKTAPQKPKDSKAVKGDISDASERKQAGNETSDKFEHQKDSEVDAENEEVAADMATDDQAEKTQKMAINEENPEDTVSDNDDIAAHEDEPMDVDDDETEKKEALPNRQRQERKDNAKSSKGEHGEKSEVVSKEGERIATQTVPAEDQSDLNTVHSLERYFEANDLDYFKASTWDRLSGVPSEVVTWAQAEFRVKKLVQELCEELRLVLEPTKVAKLRGDYRTGKRLNMRKVVDYVASGFRKDKIWLRRTQPNKREYQILLAMDDSLSMSDSFAKDRAFDTMVLLTKSLSLLEVGDIGVASFGEDVSLIHPLGEPISADTGPKLARHFTFAQKATRVAKLVSLATDMFERSRSSLTGSSIQKDFAQLLIIVSDGRNIFAEGKNAVHATVQKARENGIFVVYIIIDNAEQNKASILNIQAVSFKNGKAITTRYLESFPFPFYIILQNVDRLPNVLGQALRQWFELVMGK